MKHETQPNEAGRHYAAAYAAHYQSRDLPAALQLYIKLMAAYPHAQEAGYSRTQVQNIVNALVPSQELLDVQVERALAHLEHERPSEAARIPIRQFAAGVPT